MDWTGWTGPNFEMKPIYQQLAKGEVLHPIRGDFEMNSLCVGEWMIWLHLIWPAAINVIKLSVGFVAGTCNNLLPSDESLY